MPRPKKPQPGEKELLEAARLFSKKAQYKKIAEELEWSTADVGPRLAEAVRRLLGRHSELAKIEKKKTPLGELANALKEKYGLRQVLIVETEPIATQADYDELLKKWGALTAGLIDKLVDRAAQNGRYLDIGVSGGQTILEAMSALEDRKRWNASFHGLALIGRGILDDKATQVGPEVNATIGWARSGRMPGRLRCGTLSPPDRQKLKGDPRAGLQGDIERALENSEVTALVKDMSRVNVAVAGLGVFPPEDPRAHFSDTQIDRLTMLGLLRTLGVDSTELSRDEGAVGDLCYCPFNRDGLGEPRTPDGEKLPPESWQLFITAGHGSKHEGVEFYRNLVSEGKPVIVMAGPFKRDAIVAALTGEVPLFNYWITDVHTARYVLAAERSVARAKETGP